MGDRLTKEAPSSTEVEVRTYRDGDAPRVLSLLQAAFGRWPEPGRAARDRPAEFFRWKHLSNPAGPSWMVLAEADGRIIGVRAYMPWPLLAAGEPIHTRQAVDLATHPDYRRRGVGWALVERAIEYYSEMGALTLGLPNKASISQSQQAGWRPLSPFPVWVRMRRPARVVRGARSVKTPPQTGPTPPVEAATASDCLSDGEAVSELLRELGDPGPRLSTDMDLDYLRWRYQPMLADYRAVTQDEAGGLAGLAIFRVRPRGKLWEAAICELIVRQGDHRTARRLMRRVAEATPADYLTAVFKAGSTPEQSLAGAGFVPLPIGGMRLGVYTFREVTPDPYRRRSWALSLGDLERLQLC